MDIQLINNELLALLHKQAKMNKRRRQNFDLRTTPDDGSQRMLNVLEPKTRVPIHRHLNTSETAICIEGSIDWIFYEELPNMDSGVIASDGETVLDPSSFKEVARVRISPREQNFGIQIPPMTWHSIEVHEPSAIVESKDGPYGK